MKQIVIRSGGTGQITDRSSISMNKYLSEVSKYDLLTKDEEVELFNKLASGDEHARDTIIKSNLRFVVSCAKFYMHRGIPYEDLVNDGNIGLAIAVDKFDVTRGFKFISYAVWWIQQSIMKSIRDNGKHIRIPQNRYGDIIKIEDTKREFAQNYDREPTIDEIADILEMDKDRIQSTLDGFSIIGSLDARNPETDTAKSDIVPSDSYSSHLKNETRAHNAYFINAMVGKLPNFEDRYMIERTYGLNGQRAMSDFEICKTLEISKDSLRQKRVKILRRLRMMYNGRRP